MRRNSSQWWQRSKRKGRNIFGPNLAHQRQNGWTLVSSFGFNLKMFFYPLIKVEAWFCLSFITMFLFSWFADLNNLTDFYKISLTNAPSLFQCAQMAKKLSTRFLLDMDRPVVQILHMATKEALDQPEGKEESFLTSYIVSRPIPQASCSQAPATAGSHISWGFNFFPPFMFIFSVLLRQCPTAFNCLLSIYPHLPFERLHWLLGQVSGSVIWVSPLLKMNKWIHKQRGKHKQKIITSHSAPAESKCFSYRGLVPKDSILILNLYTLQTVNAQQSGSFIEI